MFPFSLSPEVLQDLQDIWSFIAVDNPTAADKLEDVFLRRLKCWLGNLEWAIRERI